MKETLNLKKDKIINLLQVDPDDTGIHDQEILTLIEDIEIEVSAMLKDRARPGFILPLKYEEDGKTPRTDIANILQEGISEMAFIKHIYPNLKEVKETILKRQQKKSKWKFWK
jgi:hypothetical protein